MWKRRRAAWMRLPVGSGGRILRVRPEAISSYYPWNGKTKVIVHGTHFDIGKTVDELDKMLR